MGGGNVMWGCVFAGGSDCCCCCCCCCCCLCHGGVANGGGVALPCRKGGPPRLRGVPNTSLRFMPLGVGCGPPAPPPWFCSAGTGGDPGWPRLAGTAAPRGCSLPRSAANFSASSFRSRATRSSSARCWACPVGWVKNNHVRVEKKFATSAQHVALPPLRPWQPPLPCALLLRLQESPPVRSGAMHE